MSGQIRISATIVAEKPSSSSKKAAFFKTDLLFY